MELILTAHRDATTDYDGAEIKAFDSTFESPLRPGGLSPSLDSYCYILYQNWFGRWQIVEQVVSQIWFTNIWGYKFRNGWCYCADELGRNIFLHDELIKAKEECIRRNKMRKVKVKEYRG